MPSKKSLWQDNEFETVLIDATEVPIERPKKKANRKLSSKRVTNEHVIGKLKFFKILSSRYRNRRKRFGLRVNLISAIYNFELE